MAFSNRMQKYQIGLLVGKHPPDIVFIGLLSSVQIGRANRKASKQLCTGVSPHGLEALDVANNLFIGNDQCCQEFTKKHYIVVIEKPIAWGYWGDDSLP